MTLNLDRWYQLAMDFGRATLWRFAVVIVAGVCAPVFLLGSVWIGAKALTTLTITDNTRRILDDQAYLIVEIERGIGPIDCIYFLNKSITDPMESINAQDVGLLTYDNKRKVVLSSFGKSERGCPADSFAVVLDDPK